MLDHADHDGAGYDRAAFLDRVGDHLQESDLDPDDADRFAEAVTDALAATLTDGEVTDLNAQIDQELASMFERVDVDRDAI